MANTASPSLQRVHVVHRLFAVELSSASAAAPCSPWWPSQLPPTMFAVVHDEVPSTFTRKPTLALQEFDGQDLTPSVHVYLPHNLRPREFLRLSRLRPPPPSLPFLFPHYKTGSPKSTRISSSKTMRTIPFIRTRIGCVKSRSRQSTGSGGTSRAKKTNWAL